MSQGLELIAGISFGVFAVVIAMGLAFTLIIKIMTWAGID